MSEHLKDVEIERVVIVEEGTGDNYCFEGYTVGTGDVTHIEAFTKSGMYSDLPYVRIWKGKTPYAEFCQHNIRGVYFKS